MVRQMQTGKSRLASNKSPAAGYCLVLFQMSHCAGTSTSKCVFMLFPFAQIQPPLTWIQGHALLLPGISKYPMQQSAGPSAEKSTLFDPMLLRGPVAIAC